MRAPPPAGSPPAPTPAELVVRVREVLAAAGDPARAEGMRRYMKSTLPCHGVRVPEVRRLVAPLFATVPLADAAAWEAYVRALWFEARFREERYAALALVRDRRADPFRTPAVLGLYEALIVSGAWWDLVDELAVHAVGPLLRRHPGVVRRRLLSWARDADLWKRRTAILSQIGAGEEADFAFLEACLTPSLGSREFFLRKAIGWALRDYARTDPARVDRWVREHEEVLSPLTIREARKHLG